MLIPILIMTFVGLISAILLAFATKFFTVEKDNRVEEIKEILPNANCGGCGYAGCAALANAIVKNEVPVNSCPIADKEVVDKIAEIMNVSTSDVSKKTAIILCNGGCNATDRYQYEGVKDCYSMSIMLGGVKNCTYGCLGGGSCVKVCSFNAISMGEKGIPVINSNLCTGCSLCVYECPKDIITLTSADKFAVVRCSSKDTGADTKRYCITGCIGCKICQRVCPEKIITVENFVAKIDEDKCSFCGECVKKCPVSAIELVKLR